MELEALELRKNLAAMAADQHGSAIAARFVEGFYDHVEFRRLAERDISDLYGAAITLWLLAERPRNGGPAIRVHNPMYEDHGWQSPFTIVQIVTDDTPFVVESVTQALERLGRPSHLVIHPRFAVERDERGWIRGLNTPEPGSTGCESIIHVEIDRESDPEELARIADELHEVLADVRIAVQDWPAMVAAVRAAAEEVADPETAALLRWMADDHFVFLGYESTVAGSSPLGLLARHPELVASLRGADDELVVNKADAVSTVNRAVRLDYLAVVARGPDGSAIGVHRFVGLHVAETYVVPARQIPFVRTKVDSVLDRSGLVRGSHRANKVLAAIDRFPRDELFTVDADQLLLIIREMVDLDSRREVGLWIWADPFGRFLSCLVLIPRDRFDTDSRLRVEQLLVAELDGTGVEYLTSVGEASHARVHYTIHVASPPSSIDIEELRDRLNAVTRDWHDDLQDELTAQLGTEAGVHAWQAYQRAFPAGYAAECSTRAAVVDIGRIGALDSEDGLAVALYQPLGAPAECLRFRVYRSGEPIMLSDVLPILHNLGVDVVDERPYEITPNGFRPVWIYDFGLLLPDGIPDSPSAREGFEETFLRVWRAQAESDSFNELVLRSGLHWREASVLRAYSRYLLQTSARYRQPAVAQTLIEHADLTRLLIDLFHVRFDPDESVRRIDDLLARFDAAVDSVLSLDQDRILRAMRDLVLATTRTNYFIGDGDQVDRLVFKFDPTGLPWLPKPRPAHEIFVYSPRTEGVHLRSGKVSRGGIRWSDRLDDYRSEVLGLMKAQRVKNSVIVPAGAKGGFVVRRLPVESENVRGEVVACYRTFISGLLDVTDNLVDGKVITPDRVVAHDDDDSYLVVAADKGTASFSDIANELATDRGFWLGDAFASGGSAGYDHKKMGITARGAWESVTRHFAELNVDVAVDPVTVVGIGDMSGDVFGNGMLASRALRLVAAFDHRHVFIDPDPDPELSYEERRRMFNTGRVTWADYDAELISTGGGVFSRTAKSIAITDEMRTVFAIPEEVATLTPNDLIRLVLTAPVDLLWNGGIGTFIKASQETHLDASDKVNDPIRADATELACRVIGEGGNLGLTQRARVEYAIGGGRIYTDAIDNSAGVDSSDHEVNIKILLNEVVHRGDLTTKHRNELLASMTDEVASLVLTNNHEQGRALANAAAEARSMVTVHERQIALLVSAGDLDRAVEALPTSEEMAERRSKERGLTTPELAVMLAYAKNELAEELERSDLPDDTRSDRALWSYFPGPLRERFASEINAHALRRQLVATIVANQRINRAGLTMFQRLGDETSADGAEIARAHDAAWEIFGIEAIWSDIEALGPEVNAETQTFLRLSARRLAERGTRWLLRNRRSPLDVTETVEAFRPGVEALAGKMADFVSPADRAVLLGRESDWVALGVPLPLAARTARNSLLFSSLDIIDTSLEASTDLETAAATYHGVSELLSLGWLRDQIQALPREDRWQTLARSALRDDLYRVHADITGNLLLAGSSGDPRELVERWRDRQLQSISRFVSTMDEIRLSDAVDLAELTVAVQELRNLRYRSG